MKELILFKKAINKNKWQGRFLLKVNYTIKINCAYVCVNPVTEWITRDWGAPDE